MLKHRYTGLALAIMAMAHFGCGGCGEDEQPQEIAPAITSEPETEAVVGEEYRYHIDVEGEPEPEVTVTGPDGTDYPGWLAFDEDTNTLLGLPTEDHLGAHEVVVIASNGVEPDAEQIFEITVVLAGAPPSFVTDPLTDAATGEEYVYVPEVTGVPDPVLEATGEEGGALAAWLTFDAASGTLSGTPGVEDVGDHPVVIVASNGIDPDAEQAFEITVVRSHEEPVITSSPVLEVMEGEEYAYEVEATGYPLPVIAAGGADGEDLPDWLVIEDGVLFGEPGGDDVGEHEIEVVAVNVAGEDRQDFTITVLRAPFAPIFTSTPDTDAVLGAAYSHEIVVAGHPAPTLAADVLPSWLAFDADTGLLEGTPEAGDVGENPVEITATNDVDSTTQAFIIAVAMVPVITSTPITEAEATVEYVYQVAAEATPAAVFSVVGPEWLSMDEASGLLSGTPGFADVGSHIVQVYATNDVGEDSQHFEVDVTAEDTAPIIGSSAPDTATVGVEYVYQIDATGYPLPVIDVEGLPEWLEFDGARTISGTPMIFDLGETGDITVTASNDIEPDAEEIFTITVEPADAIDLSAAPLFESFGTEIPQGWSAVGSWEFGAPVTGPDSAHEGDYLAATILDGDYPSNDESYLVTPVLDLTNVEAAEMRFHHWYRIEANWDGGFMVMSTDGGATWTTILEESIQPESSRYDNTISSADGARGWSLRDGTTEVWHPVIIDLEANLQGEARDQVLMAFAFTSDGSVQDHGWYVDSVGIGESTELPGSPTIRSTPEPFAAVGVDYSYEVVVGGLPAATVTASGPEGDPLPAWLSFDAATLILNGSPAVEDLGQHEVEIVASNGIDPDAIQAFTITVLADPPEAPEITSTPSTTGQADVEYSYAIAATGSPEPTIAVSGLPSWLSFDEPTATISGTPDRFAVGETGDITVTASNLVGEVDQVFTIDVAPMDAIDVSATPLVETFGTVAPQGWANTGDWEIGEPTSGPGEAFEGDYLAATNLSGNYSNSMHSMLLSPVMDLTDVDTPFLRFVHWYDIETGWDGANVKISTDAGMTFAELDSDSVTPAYATSFGGEATWSGSTDWEIVEVDLGMNLGAELDQVVIRFDMRSDGSVNEAGWYVDSIEIADLDDLRPMDPIGVEELAFFDFEAADDADRPYPALEAAGLAAGPMTVLKGSVTWPGGNPGTAMSTTLWDEDDNYFEFVVTPDAGTELELYRFSFDANASNSGPSSWEVLLVDDLGVETSIGTGDGHTNWSGSPYVVYIEAPDAGPITEAFTVRIRGYGATHTGGTWRIDNVSLSGFID